MDKVESTKIGIRTKPQEIMEAAGAVSTIAKATVSTFAAEFGAAGSGKDGTLG